MKEISEARWAMLRGARWSAAEANEVIEACVRDREGFEETEIHPARTHSTVDRIATFAARLGAGPFLAMAVAAAMSGCGSPPSEPNCDVPLLRADIELSATSVDFGRVPIGVQAVQQVVIRNPGSAVLSFDVERGEPFDNGVYGFDVDGDLNGGHGLNLPPDGVAVLFITFVPNAEGAFPSSIRLVTNVPGSACGLVSLDLPLRGTGAPGLVASPTQLDFLGVIVGTTETRSIALENTSEFDIEVELVEDADRPSCRQHSVPATPFCVRTPAAQALAEGRFPVRAGETVRIDVRFSPRVAGLRSDAQIVLHTCAASACETHIDLTGRGIESLLRCRPPAIDFGPVPPGTSQRVQLSCQNLTGTSFGVERVSVLRGSSSAFEVDAPTPTRLAPLEAIPVDVTFAPLSPARARGELQLLTDHPEPTLRAVEVDLLGSGGGPALGVRPGSVEFGSVSRSAPSRRSLVLSNVGFAPLAISEIQVDTSGSGTLTSPDATPGVLSPGASRTVTLELRPRDVGDIATFVRVLSNDAEAPSVDVPVRGAGVELGPCRYRLSPPRVDFGVVRAGRPLRGAFEVVNESETPCLITGARLLSGSSSAFRLPTRSQDLIVPPGAREAIEIEVLPREEGVHDGQVEVSLSSPTEPFAVVDLTAEALDSGLLIAPTELDFGVVRAGCPPRIRGVTLYNTGTEPMTIHAIELASPIGPAFSILGRPEPLPTAELVLPSGGSTAIAVGFRADAVSAYAGAIELDVTDGDRRASHFAALLGRGRSSDARQIDRFETPTRPKKDVLFVLDSSASMADEQQALGANFQAYVQFAEAQGLDFQLGVITMATGAGGGRLVSARPGELRASTEEGPPELRIVRSDTRPSASAVFAANVSLPGTPDGGEAGLRAAELALTGPNLFDHNVGFLRPDAELSIVFVSDEPEKSNLLGGSAPASVDYYVDAFRAIKGFRNTHRFSASAITAGNGRCSGPGGSAAAVGRYLAVADRTGGVFQSICTQDWSRSLEDLSTIAFGFRSRYFLSQNPLPGSLQVFVNDIELPHTSGGGTVNWTYDFATNSINFAPYSTPEPGSQVQIEYEIPCG